MVWCTIIQLVIAIVLMVVSVALTPRPKRQKPQATRQQDDPTAEAGRPIPVPFGTITINSPNVLDFRDKNKLDFQVPA